MTEELIDYAHDGTPLQGLLVWDETREGPLPAVMIAHAWAGRSEFDAAKARALAAQGYAAFALDMYGAGVLGSGPEENAALMKPLLDDRATLQARQLAALATVRAQDVVDPERVAAIGFCFGGLCVLDLARTGADVRGVASFHGLLGRPDNLQGTPIRASVLVLHGHDDPMAPVEDVVALEQELTGAGADWQIHAYGNTMHSFTNPNANDPGFGTVYNETADRRSWTTLLAFLGEIMV